MSLSSQPVISLRIKVSSPMKARHLFALAASQNCRKEAAFESWRKSMKIQRRSWALNYSLPERFCLQKAECRARKGISTISLSHAT